MEIIKAKPIEIGIDGYSGGGKTHIAREVTQFINGFYPQLLNNVAFLFNSGLKYRFVTKLVNCNEISHITTVEQALDEFEIGNAEYYSNNGETGIIYREKNITSELHSGPMGNATGELMRIGENPMYVRNHLIKCIKQRNEPCVLVKGRSVKNLIPNADLMLRIICDSKKIAKRRRDELIDAGEEVVSLDQMEKDINDRNIADEKRKTDALDISGFHINNNGSLIEFRNLALEYVFPLIPYISKNIIINSR